LRAGRVAGAGEPLGPQEVLSEFQERRVRMVKLEELGHTSRELVERQQGELSGMIATLP
jgi:hypothetical protein